MDIETQDIIVHISVLRLSGRLDAFTVPALRETQERLLTEGKSHFVADLSAVSFMDSAGMSALVSLLKRSRQAGGGIVLIAPVDPAAYRILSLTRFDQVFKMVKTVKEAQQHLFK